MVQEKHHNLRRNSNAMSLTLQSAMAKKVQARMNGTGTGPLGAIGAINGGATAPFNGTTTLNVTANSASLN